MEEKNNTLIAVMGNQMESVLEEIKNLRVDLRELLKNHGDRLTALELANAIRTGEAKVHGMFWGVGSSIVTAIVVKYFFR